VSDLDAPTGIIHACLAGLLTILFVIITLYIIAKVAQTEDPAPYEPTPKEWHTP